MLIVVTIIGILAAAIIPRVNGIMERARDLQRVNGLRTIATALEAYKDTHGHYPLREPTDEEMKLIQESWKSVSRYPILWYYKLNGGTNGLAEPLHEYLKEIPKDPQSSNQIMLSEPRSRENPSNRRGAKTPTSYPKGEFFYRLVYTPEMLDRDDQTFRKYFRANRFSTQYLNKDETNFGKFPRKAILVAKVETPDSANFVARKPNPINRRWKTNQIKRVYRGRNSRWRHRWGYYLIPNWDNWLLQKKAVQERHIGLLHLCDKIEKVKEWEETFATAENKTCRYSSKDQLYYIIKLE